jgi:LPXTG-motif cell wall-anchored protein
MTDFWLRALRGGMLRNVIARRVLVTAACMTAAGLPVFASVAAAEDYPGGTTPTTVSGDVLSEQQTRGDVAGNGEVLGERATKVAGVSASRDSLPVTGSDLAGLGIAGLVLVGGGTVLVRRTRRTPSAV